MKKRVLTIILALALCLSLPVFALADAPRDTTPPQWQQWGYHSLDELLTARGWTAEDYYDRIDWTVALETRFPAWKTQYMADHPAFAADLLAKDAADPTWKAWGYESAADFEKSTGMAYNDFLLDPLLEELFRADWEQTRMLRKRVELGGPAEGVGVMWQGEYVRFADAAPAIVNGRTMIPVRALMECVGAQVDYDRGVVTLTTGDAEIRFRAGETTAAMQRGDAADIIEMDVAPYVEQGRTYVPLRFFSQTLGYDVLWDDTYKTAVILDSQGIIEELDKNFTVVNTALAAQQKMEALGPWRSKGSISGQLTLFDTLGGNKTANLTGSASAVVHKGSVDYQCSIKAQSMVDLLSQLPGLEDVLDTDILTALRTQSTQETELILNAQEQTLYVRSALASLLLGESSDVWLSAPLGDDAQMTELTQNSSVGAALYTLAMKLCTNEIAIYADALELAGEAAKWMGDGRFAVVPGGREMTLTPATLPPELSAALLDDLDEAQQLDFSLKLRVNDDGSVRLRGDIGLEQGFLGCRCTLDLSHNAQRSSLTATLHVRNLAELTLSADMTYAKTQELPRSAPPSGARVLDDYA